MQHIPFILSHKLVLSSGTSAATSAAASSVPANRFGKNAYGIDQTQVHAAQMTNPIHHAPIQRGSFGSISGSVRYHQKYTRLMQFMKID